MVGVGNRREPTSETDAFQPTVLEFAPTHCRRLASKHAESFIYVAIKKEASLHEKSHEENKKIYSPAPTNLRP